MRKDKLQYFQSRFTEYVSQFYAKAADRETYWAIQLKDEHSRRVQEEIVMVGSGLNLPQQDIALAELLGLYHDIGRFRQYLKYKTFRDDLSENHAELGVKEIFHSSILNGLSQEQKEIMKKAILHHNLHMLPEDEDSRCLFFSKLLRDADKLDIWNVVIEYLQAEDNQNRHSALELGLQDTPGYSREVLDDLYVGRTSNARAIRNLNDYKLLQIGWVYDVNFPPTFREIRGRKYLEKIARILPQNRESERALRTAEEYVDLHST